MIESLIAVYMLIGFGRARHYARWFYNDDDEIGVFMAWVFGSMIWPVVDLILLTAKGIQAVPSNIWKTILIAGDPKPVRKARELEKRRERVRELEMELDL